MTEFPANTMRLMIYEILENNKVDLVAELPEGENYKEIYNIKLIGEDYRSIALGELLPFNDIKIMSYMNLVI